MPHKWLQFGIRTLLLFCLLVAVGAGLWRWHMDLVGIQRGIAAKITEKGGRIGWSTWGPDWVHATLGSKYFSNVTSIHLEHVALKDEDLALLPQIRTLKELHISGNDITDDQLIVLERLPRLRKLSLWRGPLTNTALSHVGQMKQLEELDITLSDIDEGVLEHLQGLAQLKTLRHHLQFTDTGIARLAAIPGLRHDSINVINLQEKSLTLLRDQISFKQLFLNEPKCENWADYLVDHPTLVDLNVFHAPMTDQQLQDLLQADRLESLSLDRVPVTKVGLEMLPQATRLMHFTVTEVDCSSGEFLEAIAPDVRMLQLSPDYPGTIRRVEDYESDHDTIFAVVRYDDMAGRYFTWKGTYARDTKNGLGKCHQTKIFRVQNEKFDLGNFEFLASMPDLEEVWVEGYPYPFPFAAIRPIPNLKRLNIKESDSR